MCKSVGDEMSKAAELDKIVPDRVSGIITNFPVRAVPRAGQQPLDQASKAVAPEFRQLVTVDED
jgi:hypothetical protein